MQHTKTATKIGASAAIAAAALIATATGASAATLNSATGAGFVGKGEVQSAFGWNNAKMQGATATRLHVLHHAGRRRRRSPQTASQVVTAARHADVHPHALLHRATARTKRLRPRTAPATGAAPAPATVSAPAALPARSTGNLAVRASPTTTRARPASGPASTSRTTRSAPRRSPRPAAPVWDTEALRRRRPSPATLRPRSATSSGPAGRPSPARTRPTALATTANGDTEITDLRRRHHRR